VAIESEKYVRFKVAFNAAVSDPWSQAKRVAAREAFEAFRSGFTGRIMEELHADSWDYDAIRSFLENDQFLMPGSAEAEQKVLTMAILRAFVQVFRERTIRLKKSVARDRLKEICEQSQEAANAIQEAIGG
jgi:hypothetical protein